MNNLIDKKTAIVLGGTVPHIELIKQLKTRGYYVVLVDYLENPPAKKYSDEHILASTLDKDKVLDISLKYNAKLVIATCIDHANATACYVLEKMGLHFPYSYEQSLDVTDKIRMKKIMSDNGIPTANYFVVDKNNQQFKLNFPVIVKPVDSNGSRGIRKLNTISDYAHYLDTALSFSKLNKALVEEYISGIEISVYAYVLDNKVYTILTNQRHTFLDENLHAIPGFAASYPAKITKQYSAQIQYIIERIAKAFKLNNTPLMAQMIINEQGLYVLELMPRIGGGQSYWNIKRLTNFDIISATIDSFEGVKPVISFKEPSVISVTNNIYTYSGFFDRIIGYENLISDGLVEEFSILRTKGDFIKEDLSTGNRVFSFVVTGKDWDNIYSKIETVINRIDVIDCNGKSMMKKDLYLKRSN